MNTNVNPVYCALVMGWVITFCSAETSFGQSDSKTTQVAVLDIAKVFKQYTSFNDKLEAVKAEAKELQKASSADEGGVGELVQRRSQLQDKEAAIYAESYKEVQSVVKKIADEYGILLVVRADTSLDLATEGQFLGEDENKDTEKDRGTLKGLPRATVIKRINSNVIYHNQLDLTSLVIKSLEAKSNVSASSDRCKHCGHDLKDSAKLNPR